MTVDHASFNSNGKQISMLAFSFVGFLGNHYRFIDRREAAWSSWRISLQSQEELGGVTGEVAMSHRRSGRESQEESCRDLGGAPWSSEFCTGLFLAI